MKDHFDTLCIGFQAILTAIQVDEVIRWVNLGLTILTTIIALVYRIYKWYKDAKSDGKIDSNEVEELHNIVVDESDKIKENLKEKDNDNRGNGKET